MTKLGDQVLAGVSAQISELQPNAGAQVELAAFSAALQNVTTQLAGLPVDNATNQLLAKVNQQVADVLAGKADLEALGGSLVNLYLVRQNLETQMPSWIANQTATSIQTTTIQAAMQDLILKLRQLLNFRPDVAAVMDDLSAIKALRGGPADAEAFHDFQVLQLAFKSVWMHAFHNQLKLAAIELYNGAVQVYEEKGLQAPPWDAINDVDQLRNFVEELKHVTDLRTRRPL